MCQPAIVLADAGYTFRIISRCDGVWFAKFGGRLTRNTCNAKCRHVKIDEFMDPDIDGST